MADPRTLLTFAEAKGTEWAELSGQVEPAVTRQHVKTPLPQACAPAQAQNPPLSLALSESSQLLTRMQRVGSSLSKESREVSRSPSVALAERNQVATLPVRLLRDDSVVVQDNDHTEESFQMKMDAHGFSPEELVVQVDGQRLMVSGQRQRERSDPVRGNYRIEQKVRRQMKLPPDLDPTAMTCCLTPSGQLWVRGQCRVLPLPEAQTGPSPRLKSHGSKSSNLA